MKGLIKFLVFFFSFYLYAAQEAPQYYKTQLSDDIEWAYIKQEIPEQIAKLEDQKKYIHDEWLIAGLDFIINKLRTSKNPGDLLKIIRILAKPLSDHEELSEFITHYIKNLKIGYNFPPDLSNIVLDYANPGIGSFKVIDIINTEKFGSKIYCSPDQQSLAVIGNRSNRHNQVNYYSGYINIININSKEHNRTAIEDCIQEFAWSPDSKNYAYTNVTTETYSEYHSGPFNILYPSSHTARFRIKSKSLWHYTVNPRYWPNILLSWKILGNLFFTALKVFPDKTENYLLYKYVYNEAEGKFFEIANLPSEPTAIEYCPKNKIVFLLSKNILDLIYLNDDLTFMRSEQITLPIQTHSIALLSEEYLMLQNNDIVIFDIKEQKIIEHIKDQASFVSATVISEERIATLNTNSEIKIWQRTLD